jgi:hypothetical protein
VGRLADHEADRSASRVLGAARCRDKKGPWRGEEPRAAMLCGDAVFRGARSTEGSFGGRCCEPEAAF